MSGVVTETELPARLQRLVDEFVKGDEHTECAEDYAARLFSSVSGLLRCGEAAVMFFCSQEPERHALVMTMFARAGIHISVVHSSHCAKRVFDSNQCTCYVGLLEGKPGYGINHIASMLPPSDALSA